MKKNRLGYTLAEVATALGIVGVIFAAVIPLVAGNIEQQKSGAILGRLVEQVVLGNQNLIQFANANRNDSDYSDVLSTVAAEDLKNGGNTPILTGDFANIVPAYWGLKKEKVSSSSILSVKGYSGNAVDSDANGKMRGGTCYDFTNHIASACIVKGTVVLSVTLADPTGYSVYFDVNGLDVNPNRVGKDIFAFDLLNDGTLVPAASGNAGKYARAVVKDGFRNLGRTAN